MSAKADLLQKPRSSADAMEVGSLAKRGRPSLAETADRGDTRIGLLKAARALMIRNDSVDFSLSQLAGITGQSPALVQYHFGNKDGLLLAIVESDAATAMGGMIALQAQDMPAEQKMRRHVSGLINAYFNAPYANRLFQALLQSAAPERAREVSDAFMKPVADFQASLLERGLREGVFSPIDPMEFFFIIIGSCEHFFSRRRVMAQLFGITQIDSNLKESYCRTLTDIIMKGIAV